MAFFVLFALSAFAQMPLSPMAESGTGGFGIPTAFPGALRGGIYETRGELTKLPDFAQTLRIGTVFTNSLHVESRPFIEGFPGLVEPQQAFALEFKGPFRISKAADYRFALASVDGSQLYIDDKLLVDNNGVHALEEKQAKLPLLFGLHQIRIGYFHRPKQPVALILKIAEGEHGEWRWFDTNEFGDLSIPVVPGAGDSFGTRLGSRDKQLGETRLRLEDALKQDSVALAALTSVVKPHQFDFRVAAYHFQIIDSFWQGALVIEIPTGSLEMKDGKAEMAILGLIKNGDGVVVDRLVYEGSRPVSLKEPITFTQPLMMPVNLYTIELAIIDKMSNKASVQIAKINPPPTPAGLSLSDMVLVRKFEPGGRRQYDPLMHQGRRVIPQLTSNYTIGDHPAVFFTVFPSQPNNEKVLLDIDYFVNGKPMGHKQSEVIRGKPGDGISFTLEPKPHEGSAEMRVTVTQGSETVTNMATFTVAPLKADSR